MRTVKQNLSCKRNWLLARIKAAGAFGVWDMKDQEVIKKIFEAQDKLKELEEVVRKKSYSEIYKGGV